MSIARNLDTVREAVQKAESAAGRPAGSVKLLAVSKFHPAESVVEAVMAGQTLFGENRVQEAAGKFARVNEILGAEKPRPELHIIGALQRNKVKAALAVSNCVQSVDRIELLEEIQKHARALGAKIRVFFEIHTGEESKAGFDSEEKLACCIQRASLMSHIECAGFMTMAPFTDDTRVIRASFSKCRETARAMRKLFPALGLAELSMGMSNDFSAAVEEGSTMVRIGTAIFGSRDSSEAGMEP